MKDAPIPNLTSPATSVRPLAVILKTIFQISRSYISGTVGSRQKAGRGGSAGRMQNTVQKAGRILEVCACKNYHNYGYKFTVK